MLQLDASHSIVLNFQFQAQRFLGLYYADDSNEHYDMTKSVQWLEMASEQNVSYFMTNYLVLSKEVQLSPSQTVMAVFIFRMLKLNIILGYVMKEA